MGVITSDYCLWIDAFEQFAGRLVVRVLRYKFAVNGEVEDFTLCLFNTSLQIRLSFIQGIYKFKQILYLVYYSLLFIYGREWDF